MSIHELLSSVHYKRKESLINVPRWILKVTITTRLVIKALSSRAPSDYRVDVPKVRNLTTSTLSTGNRFLRWS